MAVNEKSTLSLSRLFSFAVSGDAAGKRVALLQRSLIESIGHAEEFSHSLQRAKREEHKKQSVEEAAQHIQHLKKSLHDAIASSKSLRNKGRGKIEEYNFFDHFYGSCGLLLTMAENLKVPSSKTSQWHHDLKQIEEQVGDNGFIGSCSELIDLLEAYNEHKN